jgi:hypothetical protein
MEWQKPTTLPSLWLVLLVDEYGYERKCLGLVIADAFKGYWPFKLRTDLQIEYVRRAYSV